MTTKRNSEPLLKILLKTLSNQAARRVGDDSVIAGV
jgi:hypothetical protein